MAIGEEKALEILAELIKKPESKAEDVPRIWGEIIATYNQHFAPLTDEPKKKKRRKRIATSPNLGWPAGVSRAEYKSWKDGQEARGVTEGINPQEYKRARDAGIIEPEAKPAKAEAAPKTRGRKAAS